MRETWCMISFSSMEKLTYRECECRRDAEKLAEAYELLRGGCAIAFPKKHLKHMDEMREFFK